MRRRLDNAGHSQGQRCGFFWPVLPRVGSEAADVGSVFTQGSLELDRRPQLQEQCASLLCTHSPENSTSLMSFQHES